MKRKSRLGRWRRSGDSAEKGHVGDEALDLALRCRGKPARPKPASRRAMLPGKDAAQVRVGVNLGSPEEEAKARCTCFSHVSVISQAARMAITLNETMVRFLNLIRLAPWRSRALHGMKATLGGDPCIPCDRSELLDPHGGFAAWQHD